MLWCNKATFLGEAIKMLASIMDLDAIYDVQCIYELQHYSIVPCWFLSWISIKRQFTVEPLYNKVLGTMKITLLYQVSHYIRVKNKEI